MKTNAGKEDMSLPTKRYGLKITRYILEKLYEVRDLTPEDTEGARDPSNEGLGHLVSEEKYISWYQDGGFSPTEFGDVLQRFKMSKLISNFEFIRVGEYEELPFLRINFSPDFERLYDSYKAQLLSALSGENKGATESAPSNPTAGVASRKPTLFVENGKGYIKFFKEGPRIFIGKVQTRKYRLIETLIKTPGVAKDVGVVFDAIKLSKDSVDSRLNDLYTGSARQREIIGYAMKELQTIKGLKGHVSLAYHHGGDSVALQLK